MNPRISEVENKGKEAEESSTEVSNEVSNSADSELEDNSDSVDTSSEKSDTSDESKELDSPEEIKSEDDSESTDENDAPLEAEEAQHEQEQIDEANRAQEESNQEAEQELSDNIEETNQELEQEQEEQQEKLDEANKAQEEEAEKAEQEMSDDIDDANQEIEDEQQEKLDEAEKIDDESNKEAEKEVADELDDADQEINEAEKDATQEVIEDQEVSEDEPLECSESEADELEEPESDIDDNEQELETVDDTESNEDIDNPEASKEKKLDDSDQEVEYLDDDVKIDDDAKDDGTEEEEPVETNEDPDEEEPAETNEEPDDKKNNNDLQIEDPGYEDDQDPDVNDEESDSDLDDIQIDEDKTKDNPIEDKVKDGIEEQIIEKPDDYYEREMRSKTFDPNEEFDGNFDKEEYRLDYDEVPKLQLASELDKQMTMIESEVGPNYRNDPAWIELAQRKNELTGIKEYNIDPSKKTTFVGVGGESIEKAAGRCIRGKQGRAYNNVTGTCNICSGTNVINQLTHSANNEKCGVDKCMRGPNPFVPYKTRNRFGRPLAPGDIGGARFEAIGKYLESEGISLREEAGPRNILQKPIDIKKIADQIDNGGSCILCIDCNDTHHHDLGPRVFKSLDYFNNNTLFRGNDANHAVTVIGYAKDLNGNPTGIYVSDTNQPNGGNVVFISSDKFYKMQRHTGGFLVAYCNKK